MLSRCAGVNAAVVHALGLSIAHAAHRLGLHTEPKRHVGRTGADLQSPTSHVKVHIVWTVLEVCKAEYGVSQQNMVLALCFCTSLSKDLPLSMRLTCHFGSSHHAKRNF